MRHKSHFMISSDTRKNSHKNTSHQGKNDILPFLNLLDKCTRKNFIDSAEILREDRLWVRNQLKAGDEELVNMFKNVRKPVSINIFIFFRYAALTNQIEEACESRESQRKNGRNAEI
jgi:hypothetical protein